MKIYKIPAQDFIVNDYVNDKAIFLHQLTKVLKGVTIESVTNFKRGDKIRLKKTPEYKAIYISASILLPDMSIVERQALSDRWDTIAIELDPEGK